MQRVIGASAKTRITGRVIQDEFPTVAQDYRSGSTYREITVEHGIADRFGISERTASIAVGFAIRGCPGEFGVEAYQGLITDEGELERLCKAARSKTAKGLPREVHRKAARAAAQKLGYVLWAEDNGETTSEARFAYELSLDSAFRNGTVVSNKRIAARLNEVYHDGENVRNAKAVSAKLKQFREDNKL